MLVYCSKCVMPSTKPDLKLDELGVCNACRAFEARKEVDWFQREKEFHEIVDNYKKSSGQNWDCIVPVSGGKDSTIQILKVLELGLKPLAITSSTCDLSEIGKRNLENIGKLGVDHEVVSPNPKVRARLNRIGLERVGDIAWPEHLGIFTIPVRAAVQHQIPLIIWGENSQNEYGGPAAAAKNKVLDRRWLEEFGGLLGMRVSDMVEEETFSDSDLYPYFYPSDEDLHRVGVTGLFLGHFFPWDGFENAKKAAANGFEAYHEPVEGSMVDYENLDNHQHGIHDYFKFLKFGFGRATDIASLHIRRGLISRSEGLEIVAQRDGKYPWTYLGKKLEDILLPLDMSLDEFDQIADQFTNRKIFVSDQNGNLVRDEHRNLRKINYDN